MRSLKVLVLEDSPFQLMAIHQMLNASGVFDVLTAEDVDAACASLAHRGPVDVAICDLQLEAGDGVDLIDHLARHRLAHALIILSATERARLDQAARSARQQGLQVLAALQKPASSSVLHCLLQAYQETSRTQLEPLPQVTVEEVGEEQAWRFPARRQPGV
jgi:CheY-like chemotaxis protein